MNPSASPLLIGGPGFLRARRREQAQRIDLHPTIAALLGLDARDGLPGRNLLDALPERTAISEVMGGRTRDGQRADLVAARTPAWKVIDAVGLAADESFDLARDPGERIPLAADSGLGPALRDALDDFTSSAVPPPAHERYDPDFHERLRALGYTD